MVSLHDISGDLFDVHGGRYMQGGCKRIAKCRLSTQRRAEHRDSYAFLVRQIGHGVCSSLVSVGRCWDPRNRDLTVLRRVSSTKDMVSVFAVSFSSGRLVRESFFPQANSDKVSCAAVSARADAVEKASIQFQIDDSLTLHRHCSAPE